MVSKIFKVLIIAVACIIVGALVLNVLLPNASSALVSAIENSIFQATGMAFDLNGDGREGKTGQNFKTDGNGKGKAAQSGSDVDANADVDGYQ